MHAATRLHLLLADDAEQWRMRPADALQGAVSEHHPHRPPPTTRHPHPPPHTRTQPKVLTASPS